MLPLLEDRQEEAPQGLFAILHALLVRIAMVVGVHYLTMSLLLVLAWACTSFLVVSQSSIRSFLRLHAPSIPWKQLLVRRISLEVEATLIIVLALVEKWTPRLLVLIRERQVGVLEEVGVRALLSSRISKLCPWETFVGRVALELVRMPKQSVVFIGGIMATRLDALLRRMC